jgi:hypothetical protein
MRKPTTENGRKECDGLWILEIKNYDKMRKFTFFHRNKY